MQCGQAEPAEELTEETCHCRLLRGGEDDSLRRLAYELGLQPHSPDSSELATYRLGRKKWRIDWILVSPQLRVKRYAVLPDRVSDHFAVLADIEVGRTR